MADSKGLVDHMVGAAEDAAAIVFHTHSALTAIETTAVLVVASGVKRTGADLIDAVSSTVGGSPTIAHDLHAAAATVDAAATTTAAIALTHISGAHDHLVGSPP